MSISHMALIVAIAQMFSIEFFFKEVEKKKKHIHVIQNLPFNQNAILSYFSRAVK